MERKFCVYVHERPDTGRVFYVGKGTARRIGNLSSRSEHHKRIVAKLASIGLKPQIRIVKNGLSERCAFSLEKALIAIYREMGFPLANKTDGGEGMSGFKMPREAVERTRLKRIGFKMSDETKAKISALAKGRKMADSTRDALKKANTGRKRTPEQIEATASKIRGQPKPPHVAEALRSYQIGHIKSEETKQKLSKALRGKPKPRHWCEYLSERQKKPVFCITNGQMYPSGKEAALALSLCISSVTAVCKGRLKQTGGHVFEYAER